MDFIEEVYYYLRNVKGVSKNHALGIIANIHGESNFDPAADEAGDGSKGIGLFQHTFDARKKAFLEAVPDYKTNWKGQIDFAFTEQEIKSYLKKDFDDPNAAATHFMNNFEKPLESLREGRKKKHKDFLEKIKPLNLTESNFIQDHQRKENLVALMNAEPAQLEAYHRGMYDSQRFLQQSVAGGDSDIDYSILGDLLETDDYYKFEMDLSGALPIDKDTQINLGGTTFRGKSGGFDPSTRLRGGVSTKIGKDTKLSIYGEKTRTTNNIGFEIKGKY